MWALTSTLQPLCPLPETSPRVVGQAAVSLVSPAAWLVAAPGQVLSRVTALGVNSNTVLLVFSGLFSHVFNAESQWPSLPKVPEAGCVPSSRGSPPSCRLV